MKNKGFTLIEMLVVIALVAIIGTFVGVGVVNMLDKQKSDSIQNYKDTVCNAALAYVELSGFKDNCKSTSECSISISDLIKAGILSGDLSDGNGKKATSDKNAVTVTWSNGEKTCKYNG